MSAYDRDLESDEDVYFVIERIDEDGDPDEVAGASELALARDLYLDQLKLHPGIYRLVKRTTRWEVLPNPESFQ